MEKIILCGGGNDIFKILEDLKKFNIYKNKKIGYIAIALEEKKDFIELIIKPTFHELTTLIKKNGAKEANLILTHNLQDAYTCDCLIFSGGDTDYLLKTLKENNFSYNIENSNVKIMVGISAGTMILANKGLGYKNKLYIYNGLGYVKDNVFVHSTDELSKKYPEYVHLKEYEYKIYK